MDAQNFVSPGGAATARLYEGETTDTAIIEFVGELDPHTCGTLGEAFEVTVVDPGITQVILDLSQVGYADSSGMRTIIHGHRNLTDAQKALVIQNPHTMVDRLFFITGLNEIMEIRRPEDSAQS